MGSWNFSPGILGVFSWSKDFVPTTMKMTKAQCWVRIHGLPMEYWQPKVIFSIARGVGTPISLDDCTINKTRGFFARVLVDLDMLAELPSQLLVERLGFVFVAEIEYKRLLPFCHS